MLRNLFCQIRSWPLCPAHSQQAAVWSKQVSFTQREQDMMEIKQFELQKQKLSNIKSIWNYFWSHPRHGLHSCRLVLALTTVRYFRKDGNGVFSYGLDRMSWCCFKEANVFCFWSFFSAKIYVIIPQSLLKKQKLPVTVFTATFFRLKDVNTEQLATTAKGETQHCWLPGLQQRRWRKFRWRQRRLSTAPHPSHRALPAT